MCLKVEINLRERVFTKPIHFQSLIVSRRQKLFALRCWNWGYESKDESKMSLCGACCFPLPCTFQGPWGDRLVQTHSCAYPLTVKAFSLTWSVSETNHLQILLGICFIYVVAILVYKDQNSPSSWQWLTRFEFGSFAGVSLTIRLTKRLNSYTLLLYYNSAHFTPFCALLRDIVSCEYFAKAAVLILWTSVSYFHTVREIADISLRSSLTICSIISQRNKVLYTAKRRLPK